MMNKAKGPVWHKKQKDKGLIPKGLRGIDKDAAWANPMQMAGFTAIAVFPWHPIRYLF